MNPIINELTGDSKTSGANVLCFCLKSISPGGWIVQKFLGHKTCCFPTQTAGQHAQVSNWQASSLFHQHFSGKRRSPEDDMVLPDKWQRQQIMMTDLMTFQLSWLVQFHIRLYCKVSQTEFECVGWLQTAFSGLILFGIQSKSCCGRFLWLSREVNNLYSVWSCAVSRVNIPINHFSNALSSSEM